MARCGHRTDRYLATHKPRLFSGLSGTVLEIGPGAGANLRHLRGKNIRWIGVEPNPYMRHYLEKESSQCGMTIHVCSGAAEELPLDTAAVDFVISTLVLCSVVDQTAALREILRVLKPGDGFSLSSMSRRRAEENWKASLPQEVRRRGSHAGRRREPWPHRCRPPGRRGAGVPAAP